MALSAFGHTERHRTGNLRCQSRKGMHDKRKKESERKPRASGSWLFQPTVLLLSARGFGEAVLPISGSGLCRAKEEGLLPGVLPAQSPAPGVLRALSRGVQMRFLHVPRVLRR